MATVEETTITGDDDPDDPDAVDPDLPARRDQEVYEQLRAAGFTGPSWAAHAEDTFGYAHRVFRAWARKGTLFAHVRADARLDGRDRLPSHRQLSEDEVDDLVGYLMAAAIRVYRARLEQARWRPEKGRSLRSYFLQQMKYQLVRRFWRWEEEKEFAGNRREVQLVDAKHGYRQPLHGEVYAWSDPEEAAVHAAEIREAVIVAARSPLMRRIVALEASNFEDKEIGAAVGLSTKAVQMRLRGFRKRVAAQRGTAA